MESLAHVSSENQIQIQLSHKKILIRFIILTSGTSISQIKNLQKKQSKKQKIIQKLKNFMINKYILLIS